MNKKNIDSKSPSTPLKIMTTLFALACLLSCQSKQKTFWVLKDQGATQARVDEVTATLNTCETELNKYFVEPPKKLTILTYGSREDFVKGLEEVQGYNKETIDAYNFARAGGPRPAQGRHLVPPDQLLISVCHEIVHHYLESNTKKENLFRAKWFDEGVAGYLARTIIEREKKSSARDSLVQRNQSQLLELNQIITEKQWRSFMKDRELKQLAYLQVEVMIGFFFEQYTLKDFQNLLLEMKTQPFEVAFQNVTKISVEEFYRRWVAEMKK